MLKKIFKRLGVILFIIALWEITARTGVFPPLLFPSQLEIWTSFFANLQNGKLPVMMDFSLYLILIGLTIGVILALVLSTLAMISKLFDDVLDTIVAIMHPLPGVALLPLAILWFGTGTKSIIFIIVHATLWTMILNTLSGFRSIPSIYKEVGENIGLKGPGLVYSIMIPAAFPHLLTGIKIGWARGWRALIAAEMVFGISGGQGGLGWFIFQQRFAFNISGVFAGLIAIIIIGLLVEDFVFDFIERKTIKRWGMSA